MAIRHKVGWQHTNYLRDYEILAVIGMINDILQRIERKDENMLKIRMPLAVLVLVLLIVQAFLPITAAEANPNGADSIKVILDGQTLSFDVAPVNENGRVMVPMRAIFEALGAEIQWNGNTKTITATKGSTTILLTIGKTTATVNGKSVSLAVPAKLMNERTFVPLRFVAEALGCDVNWAPETKLISITSAPPPQATTPSIRAAKDEGNRIAYYINGKLVAEVDQGPNGVRDTRYSGDGWSIVIKYGNFAGPLTYEPVWYQCYNGSTEGPVYFPTNEWRTDPKIRKDQKDAIEFVLEEIEARNRKIRPYAN